MRLDVLRRINSVAGHGADGFGAGVCGMSPQEWIDLQEALLYVYWRVVVTYSAMVVIGGILSGVVAAALQIAHGGRRKRTF